VGLLVGHADHVDEEELGQAVLAHYRDRVGAAGIGEVQVPVALDGEQAVALHAGDGLADGRAALVQPLGDAGTQRRHTLLFELEDGLEVHLSGIDQVVHGAALPATCYPRETAQPVPQ
jgi:hypothetical protein